MTAMFSNKPVDRRSALVTLGSAGLGLLAMQWAPVYAVDFKSDTLGRWSHLACRQRAQDR